MEASLAGWLAPLRDVLRFDWEAGSWCSHVTVRIPVGCHDDERGSDASLKGARGTMTFLAWNCRGSGGSLRSPKMVHLTRLLTSTRAQVCFISETRNSSIKRSSIVNRFNASDALVVPSQGQSGGFWLFWNHEINLK